VKRRARIFFRWVWSSAASGYRDFSTRRGKEPFRGLAELYATARSLGWRTRNPSTIHAESYCEVDYLDFYTIGPDGNVFLCTNAYDDSCEAVGSVLSGASIPRPDMEDYYAMWYSASPFEDPECLNCLLLPACRGGCRRLRVEGFRSCLDEKWSLDALVSDVVDEQLGSIPSLDEVGVKSLAVETDGENGPDAWKLKCCAEMCCKCISPRHKIVRHDVRPYSIQPTAV
jgi:radical SAM protein with 4Fe4S-binding SPASM domain